MDVIPKLYGCIIFIRYVMSKSQQFLMLELYSYTRATCFGQLVTIFRPLRALIYNMQHMCQNTRRDPIYNAYI